MGYFAISHKFLFFSRKYPREPLIFLSTLHTPIALTPVLLSHPHSSLRGTQHHISLGRTLQAVPACLKNQRSPPHPLQPVCTFLTFSACSLSLQPPHSIQAPRHSSEGWGEVGTLAYTTSTFSIVAFLSSL